MDRKMKRTLSTKRSDGPVELMQLRRNTSTSRLSKLRVPSKDFTGSSQCSASCATTPSCWSTETSNPSTIPNSSAAVVWVALEFLSMYRYKTVRQVTNSTTTATKGPLPGYDPSALPPAPYYAIPFCIRDKKVSTWTTRVEHQLMLPLHQDRSLSL
eukprot:5137343-Amphidinium_carterae.1